MLWILVDFPNDAVVFAETAEDLSEALESMNEESTAGCVLVFCIKFKVQARDVLDLANKSIPVSCEEVEVTQTFTYGSVIRSSVAGEPVVDAIRGYQCVILRPLKASWRIPYQYLNQTTCTAYKWLGIRLIRDSQLNDCINH